MTTLAAARARYAQALAHDVESLVRQLGATPEVQQVMLCGSYAAGRCDLFTDLDVLVVMQSALDFVARRAALTRRLHATVALDLVVYTPEELQRLRQRPLVRHILQTGRVLYERTSP